MRSPSSRGALCALAFAALGCTYTVAGHTLPPIEPSAPALPPDVEYSVGDFTFVRGSSDPAVSQLDGRLLSDEIVAAWKQRGFVRGGQFVEAGAFSPASAYRLTLNGSLRTDTSFWLELLNALTLTLLPYTATNYYDLHYTALDVQAGETCEASVQETDTTWVEGLLILALPFAERGHDETMARVADHLYEQLRAQGAFEPAAPAITEPAERASR